MISEVVRLFGESVSRCDISRFSPPYILRQQQTYLRSPANACSSAECRLIDEIFARTRLRRAAKPAARFRLTRVGVQRRGRAFAAEVLVIRGICVIRG